MLEQYAARIRALPTGPLTREALCVEAFLLHRDARLSVHYAPFDWVNVDARVALVGITPGWTQTELAFAAARDVLRAGGTPDAAGAAVKAMASLAGMRNRLVAWLDGIGVHEALGVATSADLFGAASELLHTTSAVRYPVFRADGSNWSGSQPGLPEVPFLRRQLDEVLVPELDRVPDALVVPLGAAVNRAFDVLVDSGAVDDRRLLRGFPHPSGLNAHGPRQFAESRAAMAEQVVRWVGGGAPRRRRTRGPEKAMVPAPAARNVVRRPGAPIPTIRDLEPLVIEAMERIGAAAERARIMRTAFDLGDFTPAQLAAPGPPSKRRQYPDMLSYRLSWALHHLHEAGRVERVRPNVWRLV